MFVENDITVSKTGALRRSAVPSCYVTLQCFALPVALCPVHGLGRREPPSRPDVLGFVDLGAVPRTPATKDLRQRKHRRADGAHGGCHSQFEPDTQSIHLLSCLKLSYHARTMILLLGFLVKSVIGGFPRPSFRTRPKC